jgi:adenylosuccinate lyase
MSINSISPIDGRYKNKTEALRNYFSEKALIKYRTIVEINYLIKLVQGRSVINRDFTKQELELLLNITNISDEDANIIKQIETTGYSGIPATNHDVKSIEYFIKSKLQDTSMKDILELVHFSLTSEDINNLSYSLMIKDGFNLIIFPTILEIYSALYNISIKNKNISMLSRTHGQSASPTTFGKEILVFVNRLKDELSMVYNIKLQAKLNGATGNYNSHFAVFPEIDWQKFSDELIISFNGKDELNNSYCKQYPLNLSMNKVTTQIEPHDSICRLFDSVKRINTIMIDFCCDIWRYISDGWIKQKPVKGEVGSSTMPHKINPIDFENSEGNLGIANSLFTFFSQKLLISRLQRDLSDSTVLRNIGVAFSHSLIAYQSILKGLKKIEIDEAKIKESLNYNPEVISEAFQSILRIEGVDKPYEMMKDITRGKKVTVNDFYNFVEKLSISEKSKKMMLNISPESYTGISERIVDEFDPKIN